MKNNTYLYNPHSLWLSNIQVPEYPILKDKHISDIVVIGGGIVGVTTALLLQEAGYNTILVEARKLASGATGHTSAKITTQHQTKFSELIKSVGISKASLYVEASNMGANLIKSLIFKYQIECDYEDRSAFVYTVDTNKLDLLKKEQYSAAKAGLNYLYRDNIPSLPFKVAGALELTGQAQFNPVKYTYGLAKAFTNIGGKIYENSRVYKINLGSPNWVFTTDGLIETKKIIIATHFPIYDFYNGFTARLHGERSYIVAIRPNSPQPQGMFITAERPILSLRTMIYENEELILVGGCGHKTGLYQKENSPYNILFNRIKRYYPKAEKISQWSAQDYFSLDKLPYIGKLVPWYRDALVATGFAKWGMTLGSASALILKELVETSNHHYKQVFSPNRADVIFKFGQLLSNGSRYIKHLVISRIKHRTVDLSYLSKGDGAIVNIKGKAIGIYHHDNGKFYGVKPYCSHLGCMLSFNKAEKSWDCPCHASRFTYEGKVIESPATKNLETVDLEGLIEHVRK